MIEKIVEYERMIADSRIAMGRGDRISAEVALTAAIHLADGVDDLRSMRADAMVRLGGIEHDVGNLDEAERLLRSALATNEAVPGATSETTVATLTSLGQVLAERGQADEARDVLTRALAMHDRAHHVHGAYADVGAGRSGDADIGILLSELSRLSLKQGAYDVAEPLLTRLLALKRLKGEEHPEVATVHASIGAARQALGDAAGAEAAYRMALRIRERALAPNHISIATTLEHLGDALAARGQLAEPVACYQRALSIREPVLGSAHASVRSVRERIGDLQLQAADDGISADDGAPATAHREVSVPIVPVPRASANTVRRVSSPAVDVASQLPAAPSRVPSAPWAGQLLLMHQELAAADTRTTSAPALRAPAQASVLRRQLLAVGAVILVAALLGAGVIGRKYFTARPAAGQFVEAPSLTGDPARVTPASVASAPSATPVSAPSATIAAPSATIAAGTPTAAAPTAEAPPRALPTASTTNALTVDSIASAASGVSVAPRSRRARVESARLPAAVSVNLPRVTLAGADPAARVADLPTRAIRDSFPASLTTAARGANANGETDAARAGTAPKVIGSAPQPRYPAQLRDQRVGGEVMVQFTVDEKGRPDVASMKVIRSPHELLTNAVRDVLSQFRFEPARSGGPDPKPHAETVKYAFNFSAQ